jgi:hypothetical protein
VPDALLSGCCSDKLLQAHCTYYKLFAWDMCCEIRRAEACVDYSAHHALVNAGKRDIV